MNNKMIGVILAVVALLFMIIGGFFYGEHRYNQGKGRLHVAEKNRVYESVVVFATISTSEGSVVKYFIPDISGGYKLLQGGKKYYTDENGYPREAR